jgi:hypothetical protein
LSADSPRSLDDGLIVFLREEFLLAFFAIVGFGNIL